MTLGVVRGQKHLVGSPNRNSPDIRGNHLWWFQDEVESAEMGKNDLQWIGKPVTPPPLELDWDGRYHLDAADLETIHGYF